MSELPKGWETTNLSDVVTSRKGKKPKILLSEKKDGLIPYILIDEMEGKPIRSFTDDKSVPIASVNDVLVVWDGSIGKTAYGINGAIGSTIAALTPILIETAYLESFIKLSKPYIEQTSRGTGLQHINPDYFWTLQIPLSPLNEQRRIVAKLEKLMHKVDACKERLDKIPLILKRFRQSVLAAACSGRLTADWREKNTLPLTPSPQGRGKKKDNSQTPSPQGMGKNGDTSQAPSPLEGEGWGAGEKLPSGWKTEELSGVSERIQIGPFGTQLHKADYVSNGIPLINPTHIQGSKINHDSELSVSKSKFKELENYVLQANDIIMGRRGEMGRCALVSRKENGWLCGTGSLYIRPKSCAHPEFLFLILRNGETKTFLESESKGTTMNNLNLEILQRVPVPLPPLPEQQEIVQRVEALFTLADQIEARYMKAKAYVDKLTQSILAKAFRGELVPQDPNDEPASVLLERIRAKRAKHVTSIGKKRGKNKTREGILCR